MFDKDKFTNLAVDGKSPNGGKASMQDLINFVESACTQAAIDALERVRPKFVADDIEVKIESVKAIIDAEIKRLRG